MTITLTLSSIRAHRPCADGWRKLLAAQGKTEADDEPFPWANVLESNGIDDVLWCARALDPKHDAAVRLLLCDMAEPVVRPCRVSSRPLSAVETARRHAFGEATDAELCEARKEAQRAVRTAAEAAVWFAPGTSEHATWVAAHAVARAAAWTASAAARDVARDAAKAAAWVAMVATDTLQAMRVKWDVARAGQERIFREHVARWARIEG